MNEAVREIPAGYKENARGHLVPETMIRPQDNLTDDLVVKIAMKWKNLNEVLSDFKRISFADVHALISLINEEYSEKRGGEKGNVQLVTFDGRYKLVVAVAETIAFGPELLAAQNLVTECLDKWGEDARPELKVIVQAAFATDSKGGISISRMLSLKRLNIHTEEWQQAMRALDDSLRVVATKQYMRLYERTESGGYRAVPLDIAAL
jgi:hypothetical protein